MDPWATPCIRSQLAGSAPPMVTVCFGANKKSAKTVEDGSFIPNIDCSQSTKVPCPSADRANSISRDGWPLSDWKQRSSTKVTSAASVLNPDLKPEWNRSKENVPFRNACCYSASFPVAGPHSVLLPERRDTDFGCLNPAGMVCTRGSCLAILL